MEKLFRKKLKNYKLVLFAYNQYKFVLNKFYEFKTREKYVKKRGAIGTPYYVVRRFRQAGFFSNYFYVLGKIIYAKEKGYQVVVDMQNYDCLYRECDAINGTLNAWEYYFFQPDSVTLDEAYNSGNYVLSSDKYFYDKVPFYEGRFRRFPDGECINLLRPYIEKHLKIRPQYIEKANAFFDREIDKLVVLGVHIRGTDMRTTANHPIPASLEDYFSAIDYHISSLKIDTILLCTDEQCTIREMKKRYNDRVVFTSSFRSEDGKSIHNEQRDVNRENHRYKMGEEVLLDAILLSKCDYLLCGHSNVAYAAIVFNDGNYKGIELIENKKQDSNVQIENFMHQ